MFFKEWILNVNSPWGSHKPQFPTRSWSYQSQTFSGKWPWLMAMNCSTTEVTIHHTTIHVITLFSYSILQVVKVTEDISQRSLKSWTNCIFPSATKGANHISHSKSTEGKKRQEFALTSTDSDEDMNPSDRTSIYCRYHTYIYIKCPELSDTVLLNWYTWTSPTCLFWKICKYSQAQL